MGYFSGLRAGSPPAKSATPVPRKVAQNQAESAAAAASKALPTLAEIFGPGGRLEKCLPSGYEFRPSQLEMAEIVEEAFRRKQHALVEAGTGTGKTMAYLIPAIRSGRRVVVST